MALREVDFQQHALAQRRRPTHPAFQQNQHGQIHAQAVCHPVVLAQFYALMTHRLDVVWFLLLLVVFAVCLLAPFLAALPDDQTLTRRKNHVFLSFAIVRLLSRLKFKNR